MKRMKSCGMATQYLCPKTKQTHGHTKQAPQMLPATSHGPSVRGTVKTDPPTPAQCLYSLPGSHDPFPGDQPACATTGLVSGHPAGAMGSPAGRQLVRPPQPCPHRAAWRNRETVSLFRWPQSEGTAVSCRGAKEGREAHSFKQQAFKSFG